MLINAQDSAVMLIDMQEKLLPLVNDAQQVEVHCRWLLQIAQYLKIPTLITEQYPKGLGHTVPRLREFSPEDQINHKVCFSGLAEPSIAHQAHAIKRDQWILLGIETHVCVMQTAFDLLSKGKQVFIVDDCTSARNARDKQLAIDRMKFHGITIVSREMVVFEWLSKAGSPEFKHIQEKFIK